MKVAFDLLVAQKFSFLNQKKLLLAVSGGVDSMVLLHLCHRANFQITVAHCNFGLRGLDSDQDEDFVKHAANHLRVQCFTKRFETKTFAKQNRMSTQMAARSLRYQWFQTLCDSHGFDYILTAHHKDDHLETILFNFIRGSHLRGLLGIPRQNQNILRPLLDFEKDEIIAYAKENNLQWRTDASNEQTQYQRNYIRHTLLPLFQKLNPAWKDTLVEQIEKFKHLEVLVQQNVADLEQRFEKVSEFERKIEKNTLIRTNLYVCFVFFEKYGFNYSQIKTLYKALQGTSGKYIRSDRATLQIDRMHVFLVLHHKTVIESPQLVEKSFRLRTLPMGISMVCEAFEYSESLMDHIRKTYPKMMCMDADTIDFPVHIRLWKKGDKIVPLGMNGRQLVSDILINKKIPVHIKKQLWVAVDSKQEILGIVGLVIAEKNKITPKTRCILKILHDPKGTNFPFNQT